MTGYTVDIGNADVVPRGNYKRVLEKILADGHCPFCAENLPKVHPDPILWVTDHWIVTTNAWPYKGTRLHFLLIAASHVERIEDLSPEARLDFFGAYDRLAREYNFTGASILWRSGGTEQTGASVKHLHAQIVVGHPRTSGAETITGLLGFGPSE